MGDPWAYIGPLGRFPYMEAHFGLQKSTFLDPKMSKKVRKPLLNDSVTSVSLRLTNLSSLGGSYAFIDHFWVKKGYFWLKIVILTKNDDFEPKIALFDPKMA